MAYIKQTWQNNPPSTATPITAERLDHLETQYDEALAQVAADIADPDSDIGTELSATIGEEVAPIEAALGGKATRGDAFRSLLLRTRADADAVHPSPPTISIGLLSGSTLASPVTNRLSSGAWVLSGTRQVQLDAHGAVTSKQTGDPMSYEQSYWGPEFTVVGTDEVGIHFILGGTAARIWVEVDGQWCTATPEVTGSLAATSNYELKIEFADTAAHRVRILGTRWRIGSVRVPVTGALIPVAHDRLKIAVVGASFAAADDSYVLRLLSLSGAEVFQLGGAGTGFVSPGAGSNPYGSTARLDGLELANPDVIVVEASGNDSEGNTQATIQAAVLAYLNEVHERLGDVPIIMQGVPPRGSGTTVAEYTARNLRAIEGAIAETAANVIGYHDYLGTVAPLATYTTGNAYAVGDRAVYGGAIYRAINAVGSAPAALNTRDWVRYGIHTGTGNAGATAGDGTRDILVSPDNLHPSTVGHVALAELYWPDIRADLAAVT